MSSGGLGLKDGIDGGEFGLELDEYDRDSINGSDMLHRTTTTRELEIERRRLERRVALRHNYELTAIQGVTMYHLTSQLMDKTGLTILDAADAEHSVTRVKDALNHSNTLLVKLVSGPKGRRSEYLCSIRDACPSIFPQSRAILPDFVRQQDALIVNRLNAASAAGNNIEVIEVTRIMDILRRFHTSFARRVDLVMGPLEQPRSHHVSRWAVVLHFLIATWNTTMANEQFDLLNLDFDTRWNRDFEHLTVESGGRTMARIEDCMKFLQYSCSGLKCGMMGMCEQFCFYCGIAPKQAASKPNNAPSDPARQAAFKAWHSTQAKGAPASMDIFLASSAGASFKSGKSSKSAPKVPASPSRSAFSSVTDAYAYLETHQEIVVAPSSRFRAY